MQIKILAMFLSLSISLILQPEIVSAKSLYVSTAGNDGVSRSENDIDHPWLTPRHAWLNAKAGDTVYFREGTYLVTSSINTNVGHHGTPDRPILFRNYPNELVIISGAPGVAPVFFINKSYNYVEGIKFTGQNFGTGAAIIYVGDQLTSTNFHARNCTFHVSSASSTSNVSAIRLQSTLANNASIINCKFTGFSTSYVAGIRVFRTQGFVIENCEFENFSAGVYIKHSNSLEDTGISISNNYFHDCAFGLKSVGNYVLISNNLFVNCDLEFGDDAGMGDGWVGCDYNTILHNTIHNGQFTMMYQTRVEDPNKGCLWNNIKNNIFSKPCRWHQYENFPEPHIISDYNIYPSGNIVLENRVAYSLHTWRTHNGSDAHSISGVLSYRGGDGLRSPFHYSLKPSSLGYRAGSDGKDLGADMNMAGILRDLPSNHRK